MQKDLFSAVKIKPRAEVCLGVVRVKRSTDAEGRKNKGTKGRKDDMIVIQTAAAEVWPVCTDGQRAVLSV